MTVAVAKNSGRRVAGRSARGAKLLAALWALHVLVSFLAVFSLFTNRFDLWIDLRLLGGAGAAVVKILWVGGTMLVPWCCGPRLGARGWVNGGLLPTWGLRLLWPTYFLIACLIANTIYYYRLVTADVLNPEVAVPITLVTAVMLGTWALLTREWVRKSAGMVERNAIGLKGKVLAALFAIVSLVMAGLFFLLHLYGRPPHALVDVAVVLGNRVMPDGTASVVLRDRTLAAVSLYRRGLARHLLLSGAVYPGLKPGQALRNEPEAMRRVCLEHGVPAWAITLDPYGVNTRATAHNTAEFMRTRGLKTAAICTDDYHLYRSAWSFRQLGVEPSTVAATRSAWQCADIGAVVREMVAIVVYRINPNYRAAREVPMSLNAPSVVVRKTAGVLELYDQVGAGRTLIKTYGCITGGHAGDKAVEGDRRTPLGKFRIVFKNPKSKFHLSLGLDYPSAEDAERGLRSGLISRAEYQGILEALQSDLSLEENQRKLWYTKLGGEIFIHGAADGRTGTLGCVALSNADVEEVYRVLPLGTVVEIVP
jgi:vancomycin permeability regulator SanA